MTTTQEPPRMVRNGLGKMVPASRPFGIPALKQKKFLVVLQYFEGDREAAEELAQLMADLERIKNREVDVMLMRRADTRELDSTVVAKLESKFNKVFHHRCRRTDAKGYPWGCNAMFCDLVMLLGQGQQYAAEYFAFINLETDCCPLHPGWTGELAKGFKDAENAGRAAIGHICEKPTPHMNGVAVYAIDIWKQVGSAKLSGCNPQIAFDIYHADTLLPFADSTPFIVLDFQRPTITTEELFNPPNGIEPAIYHGVKDASAREAVRARHITFTNQKEAAMRTVFTFVNATTNTPRDEELRKTQIWREGWKSRGWNPIVLNLRDALRNTNYKRLKEAVEKLPFIGDRDISTNRFLRWLALESMGGGLIVDLDVLPGQFTPADLTRRDVGIVLTKPDISGINAAIFDKPNLARFVESIIGYDARPEDVIGDKPIVTDMHVWRTMSDAPIEPTVFEFGESNYKTAKLVHFGAQAVFKHANGEKPATAMEKYLRGN